MVDPDTLSVLGMEGSSWLFVVYVFPAQQALFLLSNKTRCKIRDRQIIAFGVDQTMHM